MSNDLLTTLDVCLYAGAKNLGDCTLTVYGKHERAWPSPSRDEPDIPAGYEIERVELDGNDITNGLDLEELDLYLREIL